MQLLQYLSQIIQSIDSVWLRENRAINCDAMYGHLCRPVYIGNLSIIIFSVWSYCMVLPVPGDRGDSFVERWHSSEWRPDVPPTSDVTDVERGCLFWIQGLGRPARADNRQKKVNKRVLGCRSTDTGRVNEGIQSQESDKTLRTTLGALFRLVSVREVPSGAWTVLSQACRRCGRTGRLISSVFTLPDLQFIAHLVFS